MLCIQGISFRNIVDRQDKLMKMVEGQGAIISMLLRKEAGNNNNN
ncbi:MAG: hypothetical protein PHQ86_09840 [Dehalococcoidales bacterium]|nr:hypothetical protein [Dehalococcoidales bacterium]